MIAATKQKKSTPFPRAKIARAVETLLPKGEFELRVAGSKIDDMKIVRIVTSAWKALRPSDRILKVLDAVNGKLTAQEQDRILRFSVLTPAEYEAVVEDRQPKELVLREDPPVERARNRRSSTRGK